ncbi:MAG TPA: J domain-containing protein [Bryobacteraceae bacterium]|nr:J domain-containing protein [Bryobacteraceae bacterium]
MAQHDPFHILEIPPEAGDEEIRSAYLRKVKEYPPDRAPAQFEKVRDAYELLRDPRRRTRHLLLSADPGQPLTTLLEGCATERRFTGPEPWLRVLREAKPDGSR